MKYVLSIDGGGVRILIALQFLYLLEKHIETKLFDKFDCFAGTSAGSILVSLISVAQLSMPEILKIYAYENLIQLFDQDLKNRMYSGYFYPLYTGIGKRKLINDYIPDYKMCDIKKDLMITAYDIDNDKPHFFKSYKSIDTTSLREAIDASSSATTYFPPVQVSGISMTDGAICTNSPSTCIYADVLKKYPKDHVSILSIGNSKYSFKNYSITALKTWGSFQWLVKGSIVSRFTAVDSPTNDYMMKSFTIALGHNYLRIVPGEDDGISIDTTDKEDYYKLLEIGTKLFNDNVALIDEFFKDK
jgi:patatin-like phospholipase/acyl hydrolase